MDRTWFHFQLDGVSVPTSRAHPTGILIVKMTDEQLAQMNRLQTGFQRLEPYGLSDKRPSDETQ